VNLYSAPTPKTAPNALCTIVPEKKNVLSNRAKTEVV